MFKFIQTIKNSNAKGRWVYYQYIIYLILMILTTIYAYVRIEIVRHHDIEQEKKLDALTE